MWCFRIIYLYEPPDLTLPGKDTRRYHYVELVAITPQGNTGVCLRSSHLSSYPAIPYSITTI